MASQTRSQDIEVVKLGIVGNSMNKWFYEDRKLELEVKTGMSRHSSKVENGLDWILGSRLVASMNLRWYRMAQSYGGNL